MIIRLILAWIKKYIFRIKSPYAKLFGYDYEWDFFKYATWDDLYFKGDAKTWIKYGDCAIEGLHEGMEEGQQVYEEEDEE